MFKYLTSELTLPLTNISIPNIPPLIPIHSSIRTPGLDHPNQNILFFFFGFKKKRDSKCLFSGLFLRRSFICRHSFSPFPGGVLVLLGPGTSTWRSEILTTLFSLDGKFGGPNTVKQCRRDRLILSILFNFEVLTFL